MLLPTEHPTIHVATAGHEVEVRFEDRRWVFPRNDCVLLPVANTTSELLARHIGRRLLADLEDHTGARPSWIQVEVDDCFGQVATVELRDE
jgi:6-pyruvoyltetrahydropterin/6-carboxytetrahydropterin synthase